MGVLVERCRDHLLRGGDRQAGELLAQIGDRRVTLELDLVAGASERRIRIGLRLRASVGLNACRDLLRLRDEVLGVAPASRIVMLNAFSGTSAYVADILSAINWAVANRAAYNIVAINMSLGDGTKYTSACTANNPFRTPITNARSAGIQVVVAAGNEAFTDGLSSPACTPGAISVGAVYDANYGGVNWGSTLCTDATTGADKITCFSNSASFLTLLAPGAMITAADITEGGTSQATPHVAGAIAVLHSTFPNETLAQIQTRMTSSGVSITDARNGITKPRLNLLEAARPGNDAFANRATLSGSAGSSSGVTQLSTREVGEPDHAGNASGGHSVWWKWTAAS